MKRFRRKREPARPTGPADKSSPEWGRSQALALWRNLYSHHDVVVTGHTVLDLGCSWGYMLRFLVDEFRPTKLIGTDLRPMWETVPHGWDYLSLGERIEFHAGDLPEITAIPAESVDLILCTSVLQYMTPEALEANLERAYELLRPGGEMVLRTRVFTSYIGADLHSFVDLPYAHLLFGEQEIADYVAERHGRKPNYLNWLTATTYLSLFMRAGFEIMATKRRMNSHDPEILEEIVQAFPWISRDELACAELEARLLRPVEPEDLARLGPVVGGRLGSPEGGPA